MVKFALFSLGLFILTFSIIFTSGLNILGIWALFTILVSIVGFSMLVVLALSHEPCCLKEQQGSCTEK